MPPPSPRGSPENCRKMSKNSESSESFSEVAGRCRKELARMSENVGNILSENAGKCQGATWGEGVIDLFVSGNLSGNPAMSRY